MASIIALNANDMSKENEPKERQAYRMQCKDYSYGHCVARSGWDVMGFHYNMACTGVCDRMHRYDSRNGLEGREFNVSND